MSDSDQEIFDHQSFLKNLTKQPGVYQMYDNDGLILYVGKAKNLKTGYPVIFKNLAYPLKR